MGQKRSVIGVVGSADPGQRGRELAYEAGALIAAGGAVLVTGGLGGVMEAASQGCREAGGLVLGILPGDDPDTANPYVDIAIPSGLGHARNILIAQTSDVLIAIEGGLGTLSEVAIGLKIGRPVFSVHSALRVEGVKTCADARQAVEAAFCYLKEGRDDN